MMVFDKTGTLTHDRLTAVGFKVTDDKNFQPSKKFVYEIVDQKEVWGNTEVYDRASEDSNVKFVE